MEPWRLALRLAGVVLLMVAPAALFLLLWRGLMRMRDEELVRQVQEQMDAPLVPSSGDRSASPTGASSSPEARAPRPGGDGEVVACGRCGAPNRPSYEYCRECLAALDDD